MSFDFKSKNIIRIEQISNFLLFIFILQYLKINIPYKIKIKYKRN